MDLNHTAHFYLIYVNFKLHQRNKQKLDPNLVKVRNLFFFFEIICTY